MKTLSFLRLYQELVNLNTSGFAASTNGQIRDFIDSTERLIVDQRLVRNQWPVVRRVCQVDDSTAYPVNGSATCTCDQGTDRLLMKRKSSETIVMRQGV